MKKYIISALLFCASMVTGLYLTRLKAQIAASSSSLQTVSAGMQTTVGQLFDYINQNNPAGSSNFLVLDSSKQASRGASYMGFDQNWVNQNRDMVVTLTLDSAQEAATQGRMKKGPLLYFSAISPMTGQSVNLYLFDPWPPMQVTTAIGQQSTIRNAQRIATSTSKPGKRKK